MYTYIHAHTNACIYTYMRYVQMCMRKHACIQVDRKTDWQIKFEIRSLKFNQLDYKFLYLI